MARKTIRILLVEDNDHDAEIVRRMLAKYEPVAFELEWVRSTVECLEMLTGGNAFDLMLLDYSLPGEDGVSFLRRLDGQAVAPPVIMLTGWGDGRVAAEAMHNGAFDYFPKNSLNSETLVHAIEQALDKQRWQVEEQRLKSELQRLAITDELTGVYNRRFLTESLEKECRRSRRYDRDISVLMIDLDNFKRCNDTFGHIVGDAALKRVAGVIAESVRDTDNIFRFGGEEFIVVLPEAPFASAVSTAERIRNAVASRLLSIEGHPVSLTISVGVCGPTGGHELEPNALLACADAALMQAKAMGKNCVFAHPAAATDAGVSSTPV